MFIDIHLVIQVTRQKQFPDGLTVIKCMVNIAVMTDATRPVRAAAWLRAWPYWPAISHPVVRRLLPGYALSSLGDGMSAVAVAWLALRLAPPASQGLWVGAAIAAYSVPGALGAALLGRWLRGRAGVRLAAADATLRAAALGAIPLLSAAHLLHPVAYVALLGTSSLLHAWGAAGQYTLVAEVLPARHRLAGNALLASVAELTFVIGPALAGLLTVICGPPPVIGADAISWAILALSYTHVAPLLTGNQPTPSPAANSPATSTNRDDSTGNHFAPSADAGPVPIPVSQDGSTGRRPAASAAIPLSRDSFTGHAASAPAHPAASTPPAAPSGPIHPGSPANHVSTKSTASTNEITCSSGLRMIFESHTLLGLVVLSFAFFLLYGPVEVALPIHVASDMHGSAVVLGGFWAANGVGALMGSQIAPYLRNWPLWPIMIGIVAGWGVALLPLGLGAPIGVSLASFAVGGVIYAPYNSIAMVVFQGSAPAAQLPRLLAARAGLMIVAVPLGTAFGGPLVAALGAFGTLRASSLATIALALCAAAGTMLRRRRLSNRHVGFWPAIAPAIADPEGMTATYQIMPIEPDVLDQLRQRDDAGNPPRLLVDEEGGSPLRCCLRPIHPGEKVALVSYAPLRRWAAQTGADPGPYDEVGPVFIHPEPCAGYETRDFPAAVAQGRRVLRYYAADGRILGGRLIEPDPSGEVAQAALTELFEDPEVALVHMRALEFGCFTFEARRTG
jgi:MFS transporter, DHA3 family, macrolide efflux protein